MTIRQNRKLIRSTTLTLIMGLPISAMAQSPAPLDDAHWDITGDMVVEVFEGRSALNLSRGSAQLITTDMGRGTFEFDMWFEDIRQFPGFAFRGIDDSNFEYFYFRPHQSGNPDATQYSPVYNGLSAWQIYTGPGYANAAELKTGAWVPVRLEIYDDSAQVFYDGKTALHIPDLNMEQKDGFFRFRSSRPGSYMSNFRFTPDPDLVDPGPTESPDADENDMAIDNEDTGNWNYVTDWQISPAMTDEEAAALAKSGKWKNTSWRSLGVEYNHFANISKAAERSRETPAAIARFTLDSRSKREQALSFGFSDRVKIFVNGRQIYSGDDAFLSRDYRFLGTVGFYDEVMLPLKRGDNDIVFVVSETFGGWGVGARTEKEE